MVAYGYREWCTMNRLFFVRAFLACAMIYGSSLALGNEWDPVFRGDQGIEPVSLTNLKNNSAVDLRASVFNVLVSRNTRPRSGYDCDRGNDPVNRYPFAIEDVKSIRIQGGLFKGNIPLKSDWQYTYCNSTGIRLENVQNALVSAPRMDRLWDAIRLDNRSQGFQISNAWLTNTRDDCVENDHLMSGRITNSLFDGCFVGISLAPPNSAPNRRATVELDGVLLRLEAYDYKGTVRHGLPFKLRGKPPKLTIRNSVFAAEYANVIGMEYVETVWSSVESCSNNVFLWLGDGKPPKFYGLLPDCFQVMYGPGARTVWERVRENWINCNGRMDRLTSDPTPLQSRCVKDVMSEFRK